MKRTALSSTLIALAVALVLCGRGNAQMATPEPTPTPGHQIYDDPAMHFVAPDEYHLLMRGRMTMDQLTDDPQTVAVWTTARNAGPPRQIQLALEAYSGPIDSWENDFEEQIRGIQEGIIVRDKTRTALKNGMPAYFVDMTYGEGFNATKEYAYVWADGQRGIILAISARVGEITDVQAKAALANVTATAYPKDQP